MPGRSGFFKQFASGFLQEAAREQDVKSKREEEIDLYRAKKLEDLSTADELSKREFERKTEEDKRKSREMQERSDEEMANFMSSAQAAPKSPFELAQYFTAKAAAKTAAGDKEGAAADKLKADYYQQQVSQDEKTRNVKREPTLTTEGVSGSKAFTEREQKRLATGGNSVYLPELTRIGPGHSDAKRIAAYELEKQSSAKAQQLYTTIEQASANEAGKSSLSDTSIEVLTQKAIKLDNALSTATDPTQKEQLAEEYTKLLMEADSMKNGLGDVIREALGDTGDVPAQPVEISTDQPKTPQDMAQDPAAKAVQAEYKSGKMTKEEAIQKLQELGY